MKRHSVRLTQAARCDLRALHAWVAGHDSRAKADALLERLASTLAALSSHPRRGSEPPELRGLGAHSIRQVLCALYRIVYRIGARDLTVRLIADGRRDLQSVLAERLLRSDEI